MSKKKKKDKYWEKELKIDFLTLDRCVNFVYTNDITKARESKVKELGKLKKSIHKQTDGLSCYNNKRDFFFIFIKPTASLGTISHESLHCLYALFRFIGVDEYDEEITCYHLGYLVDTIMSFIRTCNEELEK